MKVISKEDLMIIIPMISDIKSYSMDDFEKVLNLFGDDWYIRDGCFQLTKENERMREIRDAIADGSIKGD